MILGTGGRAGLAVLHNCQRSLDLVFSSPSAAGLSNAIVLSVVLSGVVQSSNSSSAEGIHRSHTRQVLVHTVPSTEILSSQLDAVVERDPVSRLSTTLSMLQRYKVTR